MFSPYYARARRRGAADPRAHCAFNVALYGAAGKRWAFTERGTSALRAGPDRLAIGPSRLDWTGDAFEVSIDEVTVPWPARVQGRLRIEPAGAPLTTDHRLDAAGRHLWRPLAPVARVAVELTRPRLRWQGRAYVDSNRGSAPLERDLKSWQWSRTALSRERTAVFYDVVPRAADPHRIGLLFRAGHAAEPLEAPERAALARTRWRIARSTYVDADAPRPVLLQTLEDAPFYARSLVRSQLGGEPVHTVHESLDLDRFDRGWVQALLPFRAPRRAGGPAGGPPDSSSECQIKLTEEVVMIG